MDNEKFKDVFKILILGAEGVGKTSLIEQYSDKLFEKDGAPIVGVNFFIKHVEIDGHDYKLQFWDFANDEKFESFHTLYYTGASAVLFVFDLSRPETFEYHKVCLKKIWKYVNLNRWPLLLIGNNFDLIKNTELATRKNYQEFAEREGLMGYIETSLDNIDTLQEEFPKLIKEIIARRSLYPKRSPGKTKRDVYGELKNTAIPDHIQGRLLEKPDQEELRTRQIEKHKRMEELEKLKEVLKKTNQVKFLVDDEELNDIKRFAQLSHQTQSEFIRTAIWEKIRTIDPTLIARTSEEDKNTEENNLRLDELKRIRELLEDLHR
jgi:small GTP-binding protein